VDAPEPSRPRTAPFHFTQLQHRGLARPAADVGVQTLRDREQLLQLVGSMAVAASAKGGHRAQALVREFQEYGQRRRARGVAAGVNPTLAVRPISSPRLRVIRCYSTPETLL